MKNLNNQYSDDMDFKSMSLDEKILSRSSGFKITGNKTREEALDEIKKRISGKKSAIISFEVKDKKARMIWWVSSVAAGILLLFGLWQLSSVVSETKIASGRGSHTQYILPDGTQVQLNSESRIAFKKSRFVSDRQLTFEGEAFFRVKKGSAFRVITPNGDIKVLGTSFNVFSRDDLFKVTCATGRVMVSSGGHSVTIEPGESAELSGENLKSFQDTRFRYITGWIDGEFYFENTPLNLVFEEIERQFNVRFIGKELKNEYFTGSFTNKDLRTALEIVCIPMGLKYEIDSNGKISISNKK